MGYGISPRAVSWFRSPAGQNTSSIVRVCLNVGLLVVLLLLEPDVVELLDTPVEVLILVPAVELLLLDPPVVEVLPPVRTA